MTGKYRGAAHFSCNAKCKLSKKVPVISRNLRGYDSHLIVKEIGKFDVKVSVIPNELEKCMAFTVNKKLVKSDSTSKLVIINTLIVYSFKVKGVNNGTKNLDSLYVGVPIADKIDWKDGILSLAGL